MTDALLASIPKDLFLAGKFVPASSGQRFTTLDPATGDALAEVARADARDVDVAVAAAKAAFEDGRWRLMPGSRRAEILWKVGELIEANADELALLESLDNGKPVAAARNIDLRQAAQHFKYHAGWCTKIEGETMPVSWPRHLAYTTREPVGVTANITPWNYPIIMAARNLAPALACGNSVILKPSEETPLTALYLARLLAEAGLPEGTLSVLPGFGGEAGAALAAHGDVDRLFFTGGHVTARKIVEASAGNFKRLTLELGGKTPFIVFPDADIDAALAAAVNGAFINQGQNCCALSRLYVHGDIADGFIEALVARTEALRVGPGTDPRSNLGPLISRAHLQRVCGHIDNAKADDARLLSGGDRLDGPGNFLRPAIFDRVADEARLTSDEVFGPVLAVYRFKSSVEAIARANRSPYGLSASVWTQDLSRAHEIAARIRAGTVWVNCFSRFDSAAPWGGVKQSGYGTGIGAHAIDEYTQPKAVWIDTSTGAGKEFAP